MLILLEDSDDAFFSIFSNFTSNKPKGAPLPKMGDNECIYIYIYVLYNLPLLSCISLYVVTCIYAHGPYGLLH